MSEEDVYASSPDVRGSRAALDRIEMSVVLQGVVCVRVRMSLTISVCSQTILEIMIVVT